MGTPELDEIIRPLPENFAADLYERAGEVAALFIGAKIASSNRVNSVAAERAARSATDNEHLQRRIQEDYSRVLHAAIQAQLDDLYLGDYQAAQYSNQLRGITPLNELIAVFAPQSPQQLRKIEELLKKEEFANTPRLLTGGPVDPDFLSQMTKIRHLFYKPVRISPCSGADRKLTIHVLGESENLLGNFITDEVKSWVYEGKYDHVKIVIYPNFAWTSVAVRLGVLDLSLYRPASAGSRDRSLYESLGLPNHLFTIEINYVESE